MICAIWKDRFSHISFALLSKSVRFQLALKAVILALLQNANEIISAFWKLLSNSWSLFLTLQISQEILLIYGLPVLIHLYTCICIIFTNKLIPILSPKELNKLSYNTLKVVWSPK